LVQLVLALGLLLLHPREREPRVRSHCQRRGTESLRASGMQWVSGSAT
jgi:hypothetical protein